MNKYLLTVVLCAGFANVLTAQPFQNGDFATPGGTLGTLSDGTPGLVLSPGSTFVTGWVTTDNITGYNGPGRYNDAPGSFDGYSFELGAGGGNGGIQQSFSTVPNTQYEVSFWMTSFWLALDTPELTISAAGQSANYTAGPASSDRLNCVWELKQFSFVSDGSGSTTLKFQNVVKPGFNGAAEIDSVQVTQVPEPSAICFLGLAALVLRSRLTKRITAPVC